MCFAIQYNLPVNTIEKDYVLNWLLDGIANSSALNEKRIFKGGTCLKKCYFEEYRLPTMAVLNSSGKLKEMIEEWNRMLAHQIAGLEPYEHYWDQLPEVFEWLNL